MEIRRLKSHTSVSNTFFTILFPNETIENFSKKIFYQMSLRKPRSSERVGIRGGGWGRLSVGFYLTYRCCWCVKYSPPLP